MPPVVTCMQATDAALVVHTLQLITDTTMLTTAATAAINVLLQGTISTTPGFHDSRHIWPLGYRCTKVGILHSTGQAVALHCTIAKGSSGGIRFCIESEIEGTDNSSSSSRGKGSRVREDNEAAAWQKVMHNVNITLTS
jgi:F/Y-rich N-terminus